LPGGSEVALALLRSAWPVTLVSGVVVEVEPSAIAINVLSAPCRSRHRREIEIQLKLRPRHDVSTWLAARHLPDDRPPY